MKQLFAVALAVGILWTGIGRAQFSSGPKYDASEVTALVDRVHADLNHAYSVFHFSGEDRERLNKAEKESRDFAQKWSKGKFDKGQLDGVISSIQHVLDNNKLPLTPGIRSPRTLTSFAACAKPMTVMRSAERTKGTAQRRPLQRKS